MRSRFHLDPVDWFRDAAPVDHLRAVAHAVWNEQRLRMRYESWTEVAEREIEPLGLVQAPDADGWVTVTVPIESIDHAAREMLRLGADAEVIEPHALRERLRGSALDMLALYAPR